MTPIDAAPAKILVLDDDADRVEHWVEAIEDATGKRAQASSATLDEFSEYFDAMLQLSGDSENQPILDVSDAFDGVDVLVVDSDINSRDARYEKLQGRTGRHLASLARHFSNVGLTVVVNEGGSTPTFDLTGTRHRGSLADFTIDEESLGRSDFWWGSTMSGGDAKSYRPAAWVGVLNIAGARSARDRMGDLATVLETQVSELLEIREAWDWLTASQRDFVTDDVGSSVTLDSLLKRSFESSFPRSEVSLPEESRVGIALQLLSLWVRNELVPPLNVVTDVYHLASVAPEAIRLEKPNVEKVHQLLEDIRTDPSSASGAIDLPPAPEILAQLYGAPLWLLSDHVAGAGGSRPCLEGYAFAEDVSRLLPRSALRAYVPNLGGPLAPRYVSDGGADNVKYVPRARLA